MGAVRGNSGCMQTAAEGYRVIDVGSLDMEYGWFCEGAAEKCRVIKHEIHTREENEAAGYFDYLDQILTTIH